MNKLGRCLFLVIVLFLFENGWSGLGLAYYAPLQNVQAWADGYTVHYKAFNPVTSSWEEGSLTNGGSVSNVQVNQGIVTWNCSSGVWLCSLRPCERLAGCDTIWV